jgi:hypothetical protein
MEWDLLTLSTPFLFLFLEITALEIPNPVLVLY